MATTAEVKERHCVRCGRDDSEVEFRSPLAMKCVECDESTEDERRKYHQEYHRARTIAVRKLIDKYPDDYQRMLVRARRAVEKEKEQEAAEQEREARRSGRSRVA